MGTFVLPSAAVKMIRHLRCFVRLSNLEARNSSLELLTLQISRFSSSSDEDVSEGIKDPEATENYRSWVDDMLKGRLFFSETWATALCYPCLSVGSHPWSTGQGCLGHCVAYLTDPLIAQKGIILSHLQWESSSRSSGQHKQILKRNWTQSLQVQLLVLLMPSLIKMQQTSRSKVQKGGQVQMQLLDLQVVPE